MTRYQKLNSNFSLFPGKSFVGIFDEDLIFQSPTGDIVLCTSNDDFITKRVVGNLDEMLMDVQIVNGKLFLHDSSGRLSMFDFEKGEKERLNDIQLDEYSVTRILPMNKKVFCHNQDYKNRRVALFDLIGSCNWEVKSNCSACNEIPGRVLLRIMQDYQNKNLECRTIEKGELLWSLNSDDWERGKFEISQWELFAESIILISKKVNSIIQVDLNSGKPTRFWQKIPVGVTYGPYNDSIIPNPIQSVLHQEAGRIIGMSGRYYWNINLETGSLDFQDFTDTFKNMRIDASGRPTCHGDYLFFASDAIYEDSSRSVKHAIKLVAFNWRTRQVDWEWDFGHPGVGLYYVRQPKAYGDYLFTVDSDNLLHLFKNRINQ